MCGAEYVRRVLRGRTVAQAAEIAGVNRTDFYKVMARYGVSIEPSTNELAAQFLRKRA
jgi:DNA-binding phage protein